MVGIDLRKEYFSHDQLNVALSRVGCSENQYILLLSTNITANIVYREALMENGKSKFNKIKSR